MMRTAVFPVLLLLIVPLVHAHELKVDGTIGVELHVEPNDAPVYGTPASFIIEVQDSAGKFNESYCNCTLKVEQGSNVLDTFSFVLNGNIQPISYLFPAPGAYTVVVAGKPMTSGKEFQPFETKFDVYVSGNSTSSQSANPTSGYLPYVIILAVIAVLAIFFLHTRKRK